MRILTFNLIVILTFVALVTGDMHEGRLHEDLMENYKFDEFDSSKTEKFIIVRLFDQFRTLTTNWKFR